MLSTTLRQSLAAGFLALALMPAGGATQTCSAAASSHGWEAPRAMVGSTEITFESLLDILATKRVVFVGESHDRFDHHLNQLEIICRLYRRNADLAIGMEAFQQPYQDALDAYVAGRIGAAALVKQTEYYNRWRFDFRLYEPILAFAREHALPVIALNAPSELTAKVGESGIGSLSDAERARLPAEIDRSDAEYRRRLEVVFEQHDSMTRGDLDRFVDVQLLWDESMAERAARFLEDNPTTTLVVIAGGGHVAYGSGIPNRVRRRVDVDVATVMQEADELPSEGSADARLRTAAIHLAPAGKLGVMLDVGAGGLRVQGFAADSAARDAGLSAGDRIVMVDGKAVDGFADVKMALHGKSPGDPVWLRVERGEGGDAYPVGFRFELR